MPTEKFDEKSVAKFTLSAGKRQEIYWDKKTPGFGMLVGATTRTWIYQRDLPGGVCRRVTLGRVPEKDHGGISLTTARQEALRKAAEMLNGVDPNAERRERVQDQQLQKWQRVTLADAIEHHVLNMEAEKCSPRSIDGLKHELKLYLGDGLTLAGKPSKVKSPKVNWLNKPLANIDAEDCVKRHREISRDNGPYVANRVVRLFKACYNDLRKVHPKLPPCPADAVTFNVEERRREPIEDLAAWWVKVQAFLNTIRRDFYIFCALTGMRSENTRMLKWGYIDFDKGTVTSPDEIVKGDKGFRVPLSDYVLKLLAKRQLDNRVKGYATDDDAWVFPTKDTDGHVTYMQEAKQQEWVKDANGHRVKNKGGKYHKVNTVPTPHRCRDTFLSIGETRAQVDYVTLAALANHSLPKTNVTFGYVKPDLGHMQTCTERITAEILKLANVISSGVANTRKSA